MAPRGVAFSLGGGVPKNRWTLSIFLCPPPYPYAQLFYDPPPTLCYQYGPYLWPPPERLWLATLTHNYTHNSESQTHDSTGLDSTWTHDSTHDSDSQLKSWLWLATPDTMQTRTWSMITWELVAIVCSSCLLVAKNQWITKASKNIFK